MPGITTFVHFSMPKDNIDEFLSTWSEIKDFMLQQPGAISGIIHRSIDDDSPFQLINVARWESPEALGRALQASGEEFKRRGKDLAELFKRLGVQISQHNYVEEVKY